MNVNDKEIALVTPGDDGRYSCWICLDEVDPRKAPDEVLRPCHCAQFVHRTCLDTWRYGTHTAMAEDQCPTCKFIYYVDVVHQKAKKPSRCSVVMYGARVVLGIWIPPLILLALLIAMFTPTLYGMDSSARNIPVAMRYVHAHIRHFDEVDRFNSSSDYISYLHDKYRSEPSLTWDQYALFAGLLTVPFVMLAVELTIRREWGMQKNGGAIAVHRRRQLRQSRQRYSSGYRGSDDLFIWYYVWQSPYGYGTPTSGRYTHVETRGNVDCCCCYDAHGRETCDCDCNCGNCNDCGGCSGGGGGGGDSDAAAICVFILVAVIVLLAIFVLASVFYLVFMTAVHTVRLCKEYVARSTERQMFETGYLRVKHLGSGDRSLDLGVTHGEMV